MNIFDISRELSDDFDSEIELTEGLPFSLKDTNKQIEYITNSKYLSGNTDEFGRDKPYYNISNYRLNVAIRATDFDTKDVTIVSETRDYVRSLLISKRVQNWMKDTGFAKKLNRLGEKRAKYGWILVKKVEIDGQVDIQLVDPRNCQVDQVNPMRSPIKEIHTLTPSELAGKMEAWNETEVKRLLEMKKKEYKIAEITGNMPDSVYENGSEDTYSNYRFFIYEDKEIELFAEPVDEVNYKYAVWADQDGRTGKGIIEDMFEAQTGTNEVKLMERDAVLMGSKTGFITTSNIIENNVLSDLDNGFILHLDDNERFEQVNTMTNALPAFDRLADAWDSQAEKVTSTFEAVTGETLPSGTPFRSVAIQNQEASSLFIYRREEMGIFLTDLFNDWIIPEVVKDINQDWILSAEFSPDELAKIDERFGVYRANEQIKKKLLNLELDTTFNAEQYESSIESFKMLAQETGNTRFVEVPKDYFKDFKFKVSVITTNEQRNKAATLESLSKILGDVANTFNPQTGTFAMLENPALASIFSKIVEQSGAGISPVTLNQLQSSKGVQNVLPQGTQEPTEEVGDQSAIALEQGE
jgi:hypothetical protein